MLHFTCVFLAEVPFFLWEKKNYKENPHGQSTFYVLLHFTCIKLLIKKNTINEIVIGALSGDRDGNGEFSLDPPCCSSNWSWPNVSLNFCTFTDFIGWRIKYHKIIQLRIPIYMATCPFEAGYGNTILVPSHISDKKNWGIPVPVRGLPPKLAPNPQFFLRKIFILHYNNLISC